MNTYVVKGADKKTGDDRMLQIIAIDQKTAETQAAAEGLLVEDTYLANTKTNTATKQPQLDRGLKAFPNETPEQTYLRHICYWVRLWSRLGAIILLAPFLYYLLLILKSMQESR